MSINGFDHLRLSLLDLRSLCFGSLLAVLKPTMISEIDMEIEQKLTTGNNAILSGTIYRTYAHYLGTSHWLQLELSTMAPRLLGGFHHIGE